MPGPRNQLQSLTSHAVVVVVVVVVNTSFFDKLAGHRLQNQRKSTVKRTLTFSITFFAHSYSSMLSIASKLAHDDSTLARVVARMVDAFGFSHRTELPQEVFLLVMC
ncbi:conserved eukaryotic protein [Moniliophthora roreri]|nr:conserved eukaryotic protein [Moniliophthora roreri]